MPESYNSLLSGVGGVGHEQNEQNVTGLSQGDVGSTEEMQEAGLGRECRA